jgi:hypothetical protein
LALPPDIGIPGVASHTIPSGYYMLFVLSDSGVPSEECAWVHVRVSG